MSATDEACPTPGALAVTSRDRALLPPRGGTLRGDCALLQAVAAVFPAGTADFTRQQAHFVCRRP